jgi:hypothetical protein
MKFLKKCLLHWWLWVLLFCALYVRSVHIHLILTDEMHLINMQNANLFSVFNVHLMQLSFTLFSSFIYQLHIHVAKRVLLTFIGVRCTGRMKYENASNGWFRTHSSDHSSFYNSIVLDVWFIANNEQLLANVTKCGEKAQNFIAL